MTRSDPDQPAVLLHPVPLATARALLDGRRRVGRFPWHPEYPLAETVDAVAMLLGAYEALGRRLRTVPAWWVHQILVNGVVVGDAGFHGPPPAGGPPAVEIGYAVVPALRGRGVASAACRGLLELAWAAGAAVVVAKAAPGNEASRAVLRRCGFTPGPGGGYAVVRPVAA